MLSVDGKAEFNIEYLGKGRWQVLKTCAVFHDDGGSWIFHENRDRMVWDQGHYN